MEALKFITEILKNDYTFSRLALGTLIAGICFGAVNIIGWYVKRLFIRNRKHITSLLYDFVQNIFALVKMILMILFTAIIIWVGYKFYKYVPVPKPEPVDTPVIRSSDQTPAVSVKPEPQYSKELLDLMKRAEDGDAAAQCDLGFMYHQGQGGLTKDDEKAVQWYRKSAEKGNAYAQYNLGIMYYNGYGVKKDDAEALKWYQRSADQNNSYGQRSIGFMYQYGRGGLEQSDVLAVYWYLKSAEQDNPLAQCDIGFMCKYGRGGLKQDDKRAVYWYRKSAAHGNAEGQYNLAVMYEAGRGTPKDTDMAISLYEKAAAQGHKSSKEALERLRKK